jgi:chromosome segregation ATPase
MRSLTSRVVAAGVLAAAFAVRAQAYDLRTDVVQLSTDSSELRSLRLGVRRAAEYCSRVSAEHGSTSFQARAAEMDLDKAQIALHQSLGDYNREHWEAYEATRDLAADLKDIRRDELAAALFDLTTDVTNVAGERAEIRADREALRKALEQYAEAFSNFGKRSKEADEAEAGVESAQVALHKDIGDFREDLWQIRRRHQQLQA